MLFCEKSFDEVRQGGSPDVDEGAGCVRRFDSAHGHMFGEQRLSAPVEVLAGAKGKVSPCPHVACALVVGPGLWEASRRTRAASPMSRVQQQRRMSLKNSKVLLSGSPPGFGSFVLLGTIDSLLGCEKTPLSRRSTSLECMQSSRLRGYSALLSATAFCQLGKQGGHPDEKG